MGMTGFDVSNRSIIQAVNPMCNLKIIGNWINGKVIAMYPEMVEQRKVA